MIVFDRLWSTMEKKGVSTYQLRERCGIDSKTVRRLRANENMETKTLDKLCAVLECGLEDIAEYRRCAPGPVFTLCKRGKMCFFSKGISAVPGAEGAPLRCQECAPHFLLSWQKKTCRARYKRKPPF